VNSRERTEAGVSRTTVDSLQASWRALLLLALSGCGSVEVSQGVVAQGGSDTPAAPGPLVFTSTPPPVALSGQGYRYAASVTGAPGDVLSFAILNRPRWASLDEATGVLSGVPGAADVGTVTGIEITVKAGRRTATQGPFNLTVWTDAVAAPPGALGGPGQAWLHWVPPGTNTDGTPAKLAGYRIYHGMDPASLIHAADVPDPLSTTRVISNLAPGEHYFAVAAVGTNGVEGGKSNLGQKRIP
jgi:hypothetical protein